MASAQQNVAPGQLNDLGKWEYDTRCATCHGLNGADAGPYSRFLNKAIPNLTTLSKMNAGVFPFMRVYETIDGRQEVQAHGPREMPIWGKDYSTMTNPLSDSESITRAKILALTEYIFRLQAK